MKLTMRRLASQIAKREGKKVQVSIGNIREVLRVIVDIEVADLVAGGEGENAPLSCLTEEVNKQLDRRRAKKRPKLKK